MEVHNFKKQFGQNFLRSNSDLLRFVELINPQPDELIIEIGPGDGALTEQLLNSGCFVHAIEIDNELITHLQTKFSEKKFDITNIDILKIDLLELISSYNKEYKNLKIVGSLPYNISKQIIKSVFQLCTQTDVESVCFLIQKEVAEDYTNQPPKAHFLYAMSCVYGKVDYKFSIKKEHFHPSPKVDGGVFKFVPYSTISTGFEKKLFEMELANKERLVRFIKQGFSSPRKTVWNNLKSYQLRQGEFQNAGFDPKIRAQNLFVEDWYKLYEMCKSNDK